MDNAVRRLGKQEVMAPLHVWSRYRVPEMGAAGDSNLNKGIAAEALWPYDPVKACRLAREHISSCTSAYGVSTNSADSLLEAEATRADSGGRFMLSSVQSLQSRPGNPEEIAALIAAGDSVWAAFRVNRASWQLRYGDSTVDDYQAVEEGGHAVVLSGYRTQNGVKQFLIHNSWGPEWGEHGYGWISEQMVREHLIYAYRVEVAEGGETPAPAPPSNGCPLGHLRDRVYGHCTNPCQTGSAPSAGFCLPELPGFPFPPVTPAPAPAPEAKPNAPPSTPAPQANQCPQGQGPDLFTGQCVAYCPNGLPAIGGLCLPGFR
jgi:hypothetical protein